MWSLMTLGLGLLTVTMWVRAVLALVEEVKAEGGWITQEMKVTVYGTLVLASMLIGALLMVGLLSAYREWMRYRGKRVRTKYVDAWKIAGERLKMKESENDE